MDIKQIIDSIKLVRENSPKKNFAQTFDLNVVFQSLDLKKETNKIDIFVTLPKSRGKKPKVCALVGSELDAQAKKIFNRTIVKDEFDDYGKDKKITKKLASEYDFFIAQANIMQLIAKNFGRVFGPRGKMPSPKAGCVVPPTADLHGLATKLENTVRLTIKGKETGVKAPVGSESMNDEDVAQNVLTIYENLLRSLPQGKDNIKKVYIKFTMGPSYIIGKENGKA